MIDTDAFTNRVFIRTKYLKFSVSLPSSDIPLYDSSLQLKIQMNTYLVLQFSKIQLFPNLIPTCYTNCIQINKKC